MLKAYIDAKADIGDLQLFSFIKCEELLSVIFKSGIKLKIMIDALDECGEPKELLKVLRDASSNMHSGLELLVSSRHEVDVYNKFLNAITVDLG
jgi:hypothetical protein